MTTAMRRIDQPPPERSRYEVPLLLTNWIASMTCRLPSTSFCLQLGQQRVGIFLLVVLFGPGFQRPGGNAAHRRHHLQLAGALVDGGDAGVAEVALGRVVLHVARAAQHLDRVVGHADAHFRAIILAHGREHAVEPL